MSVAVTEARALRVQKHGDVLLACREHRLVALPGASVAELAPSGGETEAGPETVIGLEPAGQPRRRPHGGQHRRAHHAPRLERRFHAHEVQHRGAQRAGGEETGLAPVRSQEQRFPAGR
jgi:hypothetical protein